MGAGKLVGPEVKSSRGSHLTAFVSLVEPEVKSSIESAGVQVG